MLRLSLLGLILFCSLLSTLAQESFAVQGELQENDEAGVVKHRRLFDFWSLLVFGEYMVALKMNKSSAYLTLEFIFISQSTASCPHGPLGHRCTNYDSDDGSGGSSGGNTVAYASYEVNQGDVDGSPNSIISGITNPASLSFWMAAAAGTAAAVAAVVIIKANRAIRGAHPLSGSVARRKNLFQVFADTTLSGTAQTAPQTAAAGSNGGGALV